MEDWTFLIQREGDTVWLPLELPESEILEGRYRIMARTSLQKCLLMIQVSYLDLDAFPPRRRLHRRQACTNERGLVAILPFTLLAPGVWDVHCQLSTPNCHGIFKAENVTGVTGTGTGPESTELNIFQSVQLQVLAQDAGMGDDDLSILLSDLSIHASNESHPLSPLVREDHLFSTGPLLTGADLPQSSEVAEVKDAGIVQTVTVNDGGQDDTQLLQNEVMLELRQPLSTFQLGPFAKEDSAELAKNASIASTSMPISTASTSTVASTADTDSVPLFAQVNTPVSSVSSLDHCVLSQSVDVEDRAGEADIDGDAMQMLLDTADKMAADIIATMQSRFLHQTQGQNTQGSTTAVVVSGEDDQVIVPDEQPLRNLEDDQVCPTPCEENSCKFHELVLHLVLDEDYYTIPTGQLLGLTGTIIAGEEETIQVLEGGCAFFDVQCCHPQTGDRVFSQLIPIDVSVIPTPFSLSLPIHAPPNTHILVGTISLRGSALSLDASLASENNKALTDSIVLSQQSFTVAVALNTLLDVLASNMAEVSGDTAFTTATPPTTDEQADCESFSLPPISSRKKGTAHQKHQKHQKQSSAPYSPLPDLLTSMTRSTASSLSGSGSSTNRQSRSLSASKHSLELPSFLRTTDDSVPSPMAIAVKQAMQSPRLSKPSARNTPDSDPNSTSLRGETIETFSSEKAESAPIDKAEVIDKIGLTDKAEATLHSCPADEAYPEEQGKIGRERLDTVDDDKILDVPLTNPFGSFEWGSTPNDMTHDMPQHSPKHQSSVKAPKQINPVKTEAPETFNTTESNALLSPFSEMFDSDLEFDRLFRRLSQIATDSMAEVGAETDAELDALLAQSGSNSEPDSPDVTDTEAVVSGIDASDPHSFDISDADISDAANEKKGHPDNTHGYRTVQWPADNNVLPNNHAHRNISHRNISHKNIHRSALPPDLQTSVSIPTPVLHIPDDDLVAGTPIRISVTLSSEVARTQSFNHSLPSGSWVFVKLWVQDRQTRSILDGPRWLVDFIPNHQGDLEAMTQIVLPIGCLEISVEAIAVEMTSQGESNKVVEHRTITPTNLPTHLTNFSLDDLN